MWIRLDETHHKQVVTYLNAHSPAACSLYGNMLATGLRYRPLYMRSGIYFGCFDENKLKGICAVFNDGNIMVHLDDESAQQAIVPLIKTASFHSVWGLSNWLPERSEIVKNGMKMDERTLVIMERHAALGQPSLRSNLILERIDNKRVTMRHLSLIKQCLWEGFGFESRNSDIKKRIRERTQLEPYWLIYHNKKPIGQIHIHATTPKHGYIGGVCTLRSERRKGYAMEAVRRVCRYIERIGRRPALAVSEENKAAVRLYEDAGFCPVGSMKVYMRERKFKGDENQ